MFSTKDRNVKEKEIEREERALKIQKIKGTVDKYTRIKTKLSIKSIDHYGLKKSLRKMSQEESRSALHAARAELIHNQESPGLIEAEGMEKTYNLKQEDIVRMAPIATNKQHFQMKMANLGPYTIDYSRSGRHLLLGGKKGHIISMDWSKKTKRCEVQVTETTRDIQYLHTDGYFAAAQKRFVYIYDGTGTELHRINKMESINKLSFLPHHFLLVSANEYGVLGYLDVSIGEIVVMIRTGMGPLRTMCHNPYNAVTHLGHGNGTVSLWTPNMGKAAVKMLCHRANVTGIGIDISGRYMVTSGMDAMLKVWDIRTYQPLHSLNIHKPATDISISQRGLIATGHGKHCQIWQDVFTNSSQRPPYLKYQLHGNVQSLSFCPFEDCLGIGHETGFTSIIVPGSGEPNIDALEPNPYQSYRQRREWEVKSLLEKVPSELITLNPDLIGKVDDASCKVLEAEKLERQANETIVKMKKMRFKQRGRSTSGKLVARKQRLNELQTRAKRHTQIIEKHKETKKKLKKLPHQTDKPSNNHKSLLDRLR